MPKTPESHERIHDQDTFIRLDEPAHANFHYSILYRGVGYGRLELNDTFLRRIIQRGGISGPLCHIAISSQKAQEEERNLDGVNPDGTITKHTSIRKEKPIDEMLTPTTYYTIKLMSEREPIHSIEGKFIQSIAPGWVIELHGDEMLKRVDARMAKKQKQPTQPERFQLLAQVMDRTFKTSLLHVALLESFSIRDVVGRKTNNTGRGISSFLGLWSLNFGGDIQITARTVRMFMEMQNHLYAGFLSWLEGEKESVDYLEGDVFTISERQAARNFRQRNFPEEFEAQQLKWKEYLLTRYRLPALQFLFPFFKAVHNTGYELARHPRTPLIRAAKPRILTK